MDTHTHTHTIDAKGYKVESLNNLQKLLGWVCHISWLANTPWPAMKSEKSPTSGQGMPIHNVGQALNGECGMKKMHTKGFDCTSLTIG